MIESVFIFVSIASLLLIQIIMFYGYLYFKKRKTNNGFRKLKKEIKQRIKAKQITEVLNEIIKEKKNKEKKENGINENNKINK